MPACVSSSTASALVAGFSYVEIAEITGGRTYTNVNKHIAKGPAAFGSRG